MFNALKRFLSGQPKQKLHGPEGIKSMGHRTYVGGMWDEIGQLQFDFLKSGGMEPGHYLLDIACGSLRLGVKAIPYLETGHYLGIEKEQDLLDAGLREELPEGLAAEKQPKLVCSSEFEFEKFAEKPDFAIAQSLFTHLTTEMIDKCFAKLRPRMKENSKFYGTFFETDSAASNPEQSHDHENWFYTREEMLAFGTRNGFKANYIGGWNHPRDQRVVEYTI